MNTSLFIAKKIVANPTAGFSRFIVRLAVAATALSVATMIITLALVNGFQQTVANKIYKFWGNARVQAITPLRTTVAEDALMTSGDSLEGLLSGDRQIANYFAYLNKSVVLKTADRFEGIMLRGVDKRFPQQDFSSFMQLGSFPELPDSAYGNEILISVATAKLLEVTPGDKISCYYIRSDNDIRSRPMIISGLYNTGMEEYDKSFAIADLRFLQRLQQVDANQITGYQLSINGSSDELDAICNRLSRQLPQGIVANPIIKLYTNIFDWLQIQDQTKQIVVSIMTMVAAINLITCLLILVVERTRMVGVLKAVGMSNRRIKQIFWYHTIYIAGVGIFWGLAIALFLLWLQHRFGFITMDESTYYVNVLPVKVIWWQVVAVILGTLAVCATALRLPLGIVQRTAVVKALRFK